MEKIINKDEYLGVKCYIDPKIYDETRGKTAEEIEKAIEIEKAKFEGKGWKDFTLAQLLGYEEI